MTVGNCSRINGQVRRRDWDRFKDIVGVTETHRDPEDDWSSSKAFSVDTSISEYYEALIRAAKEGLVFTVYNTECGYFNRGAIFSTGDGVAYEANCDGDWGITVSLGNIIPDIVPSDMAEAVAAWHAEKACDRMFSRV